jgi:hypothetical protein
MRTAYTLLGHVVTWSLERILGRVDARVCRWANVTHEEWRR